jgi:gamma-glutamyltranspeptidase/glutathione hydrolase
LEIVSMGPPSSGGAILAMALKYAELADAAGEFDSGWNSAQSVHALTHALSLAFADRAKHFGDPDFVKVPLESLLSPAYLEGRWKSTYKRGKSNLPSDAGEPTLAALFKDGSGVEVGMNTTHFSVIDKEGNAVALTTTVNDNFGSGFVPPGTGIVMNNEMDDFSIQPGVPNQFGLIGAEANAVAPRKRPLSSMTPTIVRDAQGQARISIGAQGGPRIATSTFLALINRLRFGLSIADAVTVPRFHHQWRPSELMLEQYGFPKELRDELRGRGYATKEVAASARMHAIERFPANGKVWGVADPRTEGGVAIE